MLPLQKIYQRLRWLTENICFSQFWRQSVPNQTASRLKSGESPFPGLQTDTFSLHPHLAQSREEATLSCLSYKSTNCITRTPPSWPNYLSKALSPNTITLGTRFQHINLGGRVQANFQSIAGRERKHSLLT